MFAHRRKFVASALAASSLGACATARPSASTFEIEIVANVPDGTGPVYLTGNLPVLGPWNPSALRMQGTGRERRARILAPAEHEFEFKITLGSWDREALGPSGMITPNHRLRVTRGANATIDIPSFKKDARAYMDDVAGAGILGALTYWPDVTSAKLTRARTVSIWTPPGYDPADARRYRVIYMHDGQNLFDPRIANTGTDWGVDEAMMRLGARGIEPAIVVGVWNSDLRRLEYSPSKVIAHLDANVRGDVEAEFNGRVLGDEYVTFLADELKPRIDSAFRTKTGPQDTYLMGSSMGGLISFYALVERPDIFGAAACLSMHWPMSINRARIFEGAQTWRPVLLDAYTHYVRGSDFSPSRSRLWADHGGLALDSLYAPYQQAMAPILAERGFREGAGFQLRAFPNTDHNEASWRARLDAPLAFLLSY
jgi:enterochelin esterase-like enzyme